jgi:hypothetical protein
MQESPFVRRLVRASALAAVVLVGGRAAFAGKPFDVTILAADGSKLSSFDVTLPDQHAWQVKVGPDGNIWVPRSDNSHSFGVPNPNDAVVVYDMNGNLKRTITGGGMRDPTSVSWDSHGNIYVTGGDDTFKVHVYKYDSSGNFVSDFSTAGWTLIDTYNDIEITSNDRMYVSAWWGTTGDDQMTEFDTSGNTVNTFSPTGPAYYHRDVALSPSGTLWVRTPSNGPGTDLLRQFDLDGHQLSTISTTDALPGALLTGLQVTASGDLLTLDVTTNKLFELKPTGTVVGSVTLQGLSNWVGNFQVLPSGKILVANQKVICPTPASETLYGSGWPGTNGVPQLDSSNPSLCETLFLDLSNSSPSATLAIFFVGLSQATLPTSFGGTLLVLPHWNVPVSMPSFGLSVQVDLPCDASLCGTEIDLQAVEMDAGASKGVSFSQGLQLIFGQ